MDPSYADNGHKFLAQSTDSHRKSNSLMGTLHCQLRAVIRLSFLNVKKKDLQVRACRCSQRYNTLERMNCRRQIQTILASNELWRRRFLFKNAQVSNFCMLP